MHTLPLVWELGRSANAEEKPAEFIPAQVPGAVQLDFLRAQGGKDFFFADNFHVFDGWEDLFYTYRARFEVPVLKDGQSLYFVSKGIDYAYDIFFNGKKLFSVEGMFARVQCDLTAYLRAQNELLVRVHPAPKRAGAAVSRAQADHSVKPAVSYGWDWHPRVIPLGIWDETFLEIREAVHLGEFSLNYTLNDALNCAHVSAVIEGVGLAGRMGRVELFDAGHCVFSHDGKIAHDGSLPAFNFPNPKLWWTHDHGAPHLYKARASVLDETGERLAQKSGRVGFRRIRLVTNEGAWDEPLKFPKTRSAPPAQLELNGRAIFAKGSNWVNPEIFPGTLTRERYDELLCLAKDAHFNCLRVWGGGIVNKESFYELADEKGILIWQEFPLACNQYPDDPHYLSVLEKEARAIILRLKKHACLGLWCGGNELFNSWGKMTEQSLALRLLGALTLQLDPTTPFIPTSPLMGMAHGHYLFRDMQQDEDVFEIFNRARHTAYTEFGVSSLASVESLKKIIPQDELFPVRETPAWKAHHALRAWKPERNEWLCPEAIDYYFGTAPTLETLVERSQLMQAQGYKGIYEHARRQKPYCAMALNWCYNEAWPCAANNSLLSYPAEPKPAYEAVRQSCRPVCLSARFEKFLWSQGEEFSFELWLLNDSFEKTTPSTVRALVCGVGGEPIELLQWAYETPAPNANLRGPTARLRLPHWEGDRFTVRLEDTKHPARSSQYVLAYRARTQTSAAHNTPTATLN